MNTQPHQRDIEIALDYTETFFAVWRCLQVMALLTSYGVAYKLWRCLQVIS
jgi:hypothetical protein